MRQRLTLRNRLVMLMAVTIVPLLALALVHAWFDVATAIRRTSGNLTVAASLVASSQSLVTESAHQLLLAAAHGPGLIHSAPEDCQHYLALLKKQFPVYANLGFINLDGYIFCHSESLSPHVFVGDRDYFRQTLARRSFTVGGYKVSRMNGKPVITFTMPVLDREGKTNSLIYAAVDLNEMSKAMADTVLPSGSRVAIMDRQGIVLAVNPENSAVIGQKTPIALLQDAVKTMRTGTGEGLDAQGHQRIFSFLPAGKAAEAAFFIAVSDDKGQVLAPVWRQMGLELGIVVLMAFLGSWLAWRMSGRAIVGAATEILAVIHQFQSGRLSARMSISQDHESGEFSRIANGFNRMAESLQTQHEALAAELARSQAIQAKLQDAQRLGLIGYWQINVETRQLWWSDEVYDVLGVDRAAFDGSYSGFLQHLHPADRDAFEVTCAAAVHEGLPLDSEFRVITSTGEIRWIHHFGQVDGDCRSDQMAYRSGGLQDITKRKLAELAVARSTELLHSTGLLAKVGGWELAVESMTLYFSEEIYRIHELDDAVVVSVEDALALYPPDVRQRIRSAMEAALQHATPWDFELPLVTARGRCLQVRTQGRAQVQDGKVVRLLGALQDITEQHASQAHLRLLETCINHLNDMVMITQEVSVAESLPPILFANNAFKRHMGYSPEELMGQTPALMHGPNTQQAALDRIAAAMLKNLPVRDELIHYTKSGKEAWVELDIAPIFSLQGDVTHWVSVERDITLRKLAEQALIDSEQRYAALFDAAPVPMWVYDLTTAQFLKVNRAAFDSYGYSEQEFLSMTLFDLHLEYEHERLREQLAEDKPAHQNVWEHRRKSGALFPVKVISQPIQYAGRAARFVVALDMSAQAKAEEAVRNHLFMLQRAADAAQAITWHQELEGTMQEIVQQVRGVIGTHQAAVMLCKENDLAHSLYALSLSDKYAVRPDRIDPVASARIYALTCESSHPIRLTQADLDVHPNWRGLHLCSGEQLPLRGCLAIPLVGRNGKNIGVLQLSDKCEGEFTLQDEYVAVELAHLASTAIENTQLLEEVRQLNTGLEQKVAERTAALTRQEALFRALAEQAPQAVWTTDPRGSVTYCNRTWLDLVGGELKDWTGHRWLSVVHPDDRADVMANWMVSQANLSLYEGTRRVLAKDGSCHTMAYRASAVLDDHGKVVFWVGIDADITEIKAIEAALRLSNQELEAFSYSVSHDLRAPLNTIDGFSRLLAKQMASTSSEKVQHYLSRIQAGVAQMGQLIEDLLSLSQVARTQLRIEPLDLSMQALRILDEWRVRQPERQVTVKIEDGLHAEGDGRLVRVVLENLLGNAWKFTSRQIPAELSMGQTFDAAGLPVFFVRDNGAGFDMAYADKLFSPFQRLHAVSEFPGVGIGLATVSRVIKRHGGLLWAESAPGLGATFFFTLPKVSLPS